MNEIISKTVCRQETHDFYLVHENFDIIEIQAEMTIPQQLYNREIFLRNFDFIS